MLNSFKRILIATDYSDAAERALDYACSIANRFGAELHILHVVDDPMSLPVPGTDPDRKNALEATFRLGEYGKNLRLEPTVPVVRRVRVGYASDEINVYASEQDIDLIVLGTQGRHGLARFMMGSVAEKTVRLAKCPVLTTHYSHCPESKSEDDQVRFRRILVATDFSLAAGRARDLAVSLAATFGADVHLLNVVVEPLPLPGPEGTWIPPEQVTPTYVTEALQKLAHEAADVESQLGRPIIRDVKIGYPIDTIERYVAEHGIDLIVLGTQGHRGLSHLLLGSIAEKIVRMATCPVLTTH